MTKATVDSTAFRGALGRFATGLVVVSGCDGGTPVGFTCQSFTSVSLDPPLVSFCVSEQSTSYPAIRASGHFAVSVLAEDQQWISERFARSGDHKWRGVAWHPAASGIPVVRDALTWLDCAVVAEHEAGDHLIVVGRVDQLDHGRAGAEPLVYHRGRYRGLAEPFAASSE